MIKWVKYHKKSQPKYFPLRLGAFAGFNLFFVFFVPFVVSFLFFTAFCLMPCFLQIRENLCKSVSKKRKYIMESSNKRCDNCFFSLWIINPDRPFLICKQKENKVGRWWGVPLDAKCSNFYPSSTFKAGSEAARRIPLTRGKFALVDAEDYYRLLQYKWQAMLGRTTIYATGRADGKATKMHRLIMDAPDHLVVDHIDHNGLNNCKSNLRLCTSAQNSRNMFSSNGSTSRYKGVCWLKREKKWDAKIRLNGKIYNLGYFTDEIAAAKAYDKKAMELHQEFACLNFPPETKV
jgi:hypothetical protein